MSEENKALVRRFYEEFLNAGNLDRADELVASDCALYFNGEETGKGPEDFKQTLATVRAGFPDVRYTIDDLISEGDLVAVRFTFRGTHEGEFRGISATGRRVELEGMEFYRVAGGKIRANPVQFNFLGMMQQLGALPASSS